jgi:hypothetical protein
MASHYCYLLLNYNNWSTCGICMFLHYILSHIYYLLISEDRYLTLNLNVIINDNAMNKMHFASCFKDVVKLSSTKVKKIVGGFYDYYIDYNKLCEMFI